MEIGKNCEEGRSTQLLRESGWAVMEVTCKSI